MATCLITKGRLEPCKDKVGGLYRVYFVNYGTTSGFTYSATDESMSAVTWAPGSVPTVLYQYDLKGTSTFTQSMTSSRENGTTFVTQTLTLSLKGLSAESNHEIKLLAYGRPHVFVTDNNGNTWFAGKLNGMELTTSDSATGAAFGDGYLYTLTLVGMEPEYANLVKDSSLTKPVADLPVTITIGS